MAFLGVEVIVSPSLRALRVTLESEYTRDDRSLKPAARSCDNCKWPDLCKADRLCWAAEKAAIAAERAAPPAHVWTREEVITAIQAWERDRGRPPARKEWAVTTAAHPTAEDAVRLFGGWTAALNAAGFKALGPYGKPRGKA